MFPKNVAEQLLRPAFLAPQSSCDKVEIPAVTVLMKLAPYSFLQDPDQVSLSI